MSLATPVGEVYTFRDVKNNQAHLKMYLPASVADVDMVTQFRRYAVDLFSLQTGRGKLAPDGTTLIVGARGPFTSNQQEWSISANSDGDYRSVEDKAVFVFGDAAGGLHRYQVANPESDLFMADGETIDVSQAVNKQLIADMLHATFSGTAPNVDIVSPVCGPSGALLVQWIGGYRRRAKQQRKLTIYTLAPDLGGPAE